MVAMTAVSGDAQATSIKTPTLGSFEVKSVLDVEQSFSASGSSAGLADDGAPLETPLDPSSAEWVRHLPPTEINKLDLGTPDAWVPRHPDLIRLTGRHPFNCEPTPEALYDNGYITPSNLHYVRNHGAVPRIRWEDHRLEIKGAVGKPTVFTMDQILTFPTVTVTCTLTCAGNRRKEQNMHKKTIGFNWGPAGTGCSEWTGVRLSDLLKYCEIKKPSEGAKYVCLNGPKGELPQGTDGSYGTSITHYKAMEEGSDVILAYMQNGRLLTPDHGYPLRSIIPGYIGGRMVKWIEDITVQEDESYNHYHYHDNRVLPSHVDAETAVSEGWWYKPDYMIKDLNIQSAVIYPAHNEVVSLKKKTHTIKGYAYTGGGHKIIRCEVTLDGGKTWINGDIQMEEKPNESLKYYAWVFWSVEVPMVDMLKCKEIVCRAWDDGMNTQPEQLTWNVMGMMNNCWFRVRVHPIVDEQGELALKFEHPTIAGVTMGGWMNPVVEGAAEVEEVKAVAAAPPAGARIITMAEVELHDNRESAWFVHEGKVYDGTPFLKDHPGGGDSILLVAGQDATEEFNAIHSDKSKKQLMGFYIGELGVTSSRPATALEMEASLVTLDPKRKVPVPLIEREELTHDTRRYRFGLPSTKHRLGLPCGKHAFMYARINGELVMRAYTPTSRDEELGYVDFVIKVYFAGSPSFPDGGKMSQHLDQMKLGDTIELKGPVGHFHYTGKGTYSIDGVAKTTTHISAVAGGTGVTPIYQVIRAIIADPEDTTQLSLIFANRTPGDILLRKELDSFAAEDERIKVYHVVGATNNLEWSQGVGRVTNEMMDQHLFPGAPTTLGVMCGPPGLLEFVVHPGMDRMGYPKELQIEF